MISATAAISAVNILSSLNKAMPAPIAATLTQKVAAYSASFCLRLFKGSPQELIGLPDFPALTHWLEKCASLSTFLNREGGNCKQRGSLPQVITSPREFYRVPGAGAPRLCISQRPLNKKAEACSSAGKSRNCLDVVGQAEFHYH